MVSDFGFHCIVIWHTCFLFLVLKAALHSKVFALSDPTRLFNYLNMLSHLVILSLLLVGIKNFTVFVFCDSTSSYLFNIVTISRAGILYVSM